MSEFDISLVTFRDIPDLTPDDQLLSRELTKRGIRVRPVTWSDVSVDWSNSHLTILRSTWDYFRHPVWFLRWLDHADPLTRILNPAAIVQWNHDKHYLDDLRAEGVATVPTLFADRQSNVGLSDAVAIFDTSDLVIKPAIGGAAFGTRRFSVGRERHQAQVHLDDLLATGSAMIQPFLPSVLKERERSLVFFGGKFSHAYLKTPFSAGTLGGQAGEIAYQPFPSELRLARSALDCCKHPIAYARVDIALLDGEPHLMELELIEPALHFHLGEGAEARFADVLEQELGRECCVA